MPLAIEPWHECHSWASRVKELLQSGVHKVSANVSRPNKGDQLTCRHSSCQELTEAIGLTIDTGLCIPPEATHRAAHVPWDRCQLGIPCAQGWDARGVA
eukprot:1150910-Pelagomonas_calceolata.AAC.3